MALIFHCHAIFTIEISMSFSILLGPNHAATWHAPWSLFVGTLGYSIWAWGHSSTMASHFSWGPAPTWLAYDLGRSALTKHLRYGVHWFWSSFSTSISSPSHGSRQQLPRHDNQPVSSILISASWLWLQKPTTTWFMDTWWTGVPPMVHPLVDSSDTNHYWMVNHG